MLNLSRCTYYSPIHLCKKKISCARRRIALLSLPDRRSSRVAENIPLCTSQKVFCPVEKFSVFTRSRLLANPSTFSFISSTAPFVNIKSQSSLSPPNWYRRRRSLPTVAYRFEFPRPLLSMIMTSISVSHDLSTPTVSLNFFCNIRSLIKFIISVPFPPVTRLRRARRSVSTVFPSIVSERN